jgi:hypothetical protein
MRNNDEDLVKLPLEMRSILRIIGGPTDTIRGITLAIIGRPNLGCSVGGIRVNTGVQHYAEENPTKALQNLY